MRAARCGEANPANDRAAQEWPGRKQDALTNEHKSTVDANKETETDEKKTKTQHKLFRMHPRVP